MENSESLPNVPSHPRAVGHGGGSWPPAPVAEPPLQESAGDDPDFGGLREYWQILFRRKGTILLITTLCCLGGLLVSLPQTPVYQARTSLEILGVNENFLNMGSVNPTTTSSAIYPEADLQTQVKILQSQSMLRRVIAKLKLEDRPELAAQPSRLSAWRRILRLPQPAPRPARERAMAMAVENVTVRSSGQIRLIEILCDSADPRLAADFANTLANEFIEQNLEVRWNSTQRTGHWLTRQIEDLKIKLEKSEDELQTYARASGLMFSSEKENLTDVALRQLQGELSKAQADRVTRQSLYELAESGPPDSLPEVLDDRGLRDYQGKIAELRRQSAELSSSFTPAYYKVRRVEAQIRELEAALAKECASVRKRISNEYEAARRRERLLAAAYADQAKVVSEQAGKAIHYSILKREVDTNRQLYEAMLQKVKEAGIASAIRASNVRVVDPAEPPGGPYKPNHLQNSAVGLTLGIFLGVAFVLIQESADRRLKAPGDIALYVKLQELGVIPARRADPAAPSGKRRFLLKVRRRRSGVEKAGTSGPESDRVELVAWRRKPSLLAESFRSTLASILFTGQNGDRPRVMVLTSPGPEEGKTTVTANLGVLLAGLYPRVLLVEGDMHRPQLHHIFSLPNDHGLSSLLRGNQPVEQFSAEALGQETEVPGLYVLTSGPKENGMSELFYSNRLAALTRRLRQEFDAILVDTPPMLHISDARVLARQADAVVLVFRARETTRKAAQAAKQRLAEDGTRLLGAVLNDWDPDADGYGYYYKYYEYYSSSSKGS